MIHFKRQLIIDKILDIGIYSTAELIGMNSEQLKYLFIKLRHHIRCEKKRVKNIRKFLKLD